MVHGVTGTAGVHGLSLGLYSSSEIKSFSVVSVTNPASNDEVTERPLQGGLYDLRMGPADNFSERCETCAQTYMQCPGHFGHIDLALPLYNPLFTKFTVLLLNMTCHQCYHFKITKSVIDRYLYQMGQLKKTSSSKKMEDNQKYSFTPESVGDEAAFQRLLESFFSEANQTKCERCGAISPKYCLEGTNRILQMPNTSSYSDGDVSNISIGKEEASSYNNNNADDDGSSWNKDDDPSLLKPDEDEDFEVVEDLENGDQSASSSDDEKDIVEEKKKEDKIEDEKKKDGDDNYKKYKEGRNVNDDGNDDEEDDDDNYGNPKQSPLPKQQQHRYISPLEVKDVIEKTFVVESDLMSYVCEFLDKKNEEEQLLEGENQSTNQHIYSNNNLCVKALKNPKEFLFLSRILVTPPRFRPLSRLLDGLFDHPQNVTYSKIINCNLSLSKIMLMNDPKKSDDDDDDDHIINNNNNNNNNNNLTKQQLMRLWSELQKQVNSLLDSTIASGSGDSATQSGLQQLIEKKEGIFRMNMMGKRVNYAARSVISPDPYISIGEIGVPPYFAERLTFPEHVNTWNADKLIRNVENGASSYPGALVIEDTSYAGSNLLLKHLSRKKREKIAKGLAMNALPNSSSRYHESSPLLLKKGKPTMKEEKSTTTPMVPCKIVHRHALTGDVVLVNRQPTLHKPSILAHNIRVLKGERTIRLHYANCSGYNADFDGDEINIHLPQDQQSRAEAYSIMHSCEQYIVPTDGKPIKGLIQDHIVSSVFLTLQDTFLSARHYRMLVYESCCMLPRLNKNHRIHLLPPAIFKPAKCWTGKQVVSSVLVNVLSSAGKLPFTGSFKTKVPKSYWGDSLTSRKQKSIGSLESELHVRNSIIVHGIVDKAQYGKYGLVHAIQELYGSEVMSQLMSCFSRLFTKFLQIHGFTCSIDDLLLLQSSEKSRDLFLRTANKSVLKATANLLEMSPPMKKADEDAVAARLREQLTGANKDAFGVKYDAVCSTALNQVSSESVKACLPRGPTKAFPKNNFAMMTASGAKGSSVNHSQISVLLGQQELEGRRVPRMESGKTLPCFKPFEIAPRAGGFIADRFLTGLQPQEYFFHCMAGREGLVDTTVKTARSGYLQRCLVKSLESLGVKYDGTVRDVRGDFEGGPMRKKGCGSIVQFKYGEDGIDPVKEPYLYQFEFLVQNLMPLARKLKCNVNLNDSGDDHSKEGEVVSDRFDSEWNRYAQTALDGKDSPLSSFTHPKAAKRMKRSKGEPRLSETHLQFQKSLQGMLNANYLSCMAVPGEAVGVVAAQSIGEPSTQMTLNTFHHAGRGEANVTLGIPRLRELLMSASAQIATPYIRVPFYQNVSRTKANEVAGNLANVNLLQILKKIAVTEKPLEWNGTAIVQAFSISLTFFPLEKYRRAGVNLKRKDVDKCVIYSFKYSLKAKLKSLCKETVNMEVDTGSTSAAEDGSQVEESTDDDFTITLAMDIHSRKKIPMIEICEKVALGSYVTISSGVDSADVVTTNDGRLELLVQGQIDDLLRSVFEIGNILDLSNLESNDIHAIARIFGIEAARQMLEIEVGKVFGAYGINIDKRHMSLLSDFMTTTGTFKGCNRSTLSYFGSPMLQMSFETATQFLRRAVLYNTKDDMRSPSSSIAVGQLLTSSGTGFCDILYKAH